MNTEIQTPVAVAEAALVAAKAAAENAATALKEAKVYAKDVETALKSLPEDDAVNRAAGEAALAEAAEAVTEATTAHEAAKAALKAAKDAVPAARKQMREDAKAAKAAEKEAKAAAKANRVSQNGMTQPAPGTISATLWDIFDEVSAAKGAPAAIGEVFDIAKERGVVDASIRAGYAHWRKFHGVTGRIESAESLQAKADKAAAKQAKEAAKAEAKAAKEAEAAAKAAAEAAAPAEDKPKRGKK